MIEELKPYGLYKSTGLRWAERIPSHWEVDRARSCLQKLNVRSPNGSEELLTVSSARGVVPRKTATVTMFKAKSYSGYKLCWPDDLVINSLWAWAGGLGVSRHHGIVSSAYGVYRLRPSSKLAPRYLHELVRSAPFNWELQVRSKGIWISRLQLSDDAFLSAPVLVPPPDEQAAIVRFLDHANRRIDQFIRSKKKLAALLSEQKQAIIHRAVTRGLNPNIKRKDSGVPWIGHIPAHWRTPMLGRCIAFIEQGWSPVAAEGAFSEDQWAVVTLSSVRRGQFNPLAVKPISRSAVVPSELALRNGDFLLTRSNTRERVGDVCIVSGVRPKTILCDLIYRLTLRTDAILPAFLAFQLMSPLGRWQIESSARGSSGTMPKIAQTHIKSWRLFLPPIAEQKELVARVAAETASLTTTIQTTEREIALMLEYRTRLVSDVVTGRVDVRAAAASLPGIESEAAPSEPSDEDETDIDGNEAA